MPIIDQERVKRVKEQLARQEQERSAPGYSPPARPEMRPQGHRPIKLTATDIATAMPGGFWRRFVATIIDGIVLWFFLIPINVAFSLLLHLTIKASITPYQGGDPNQAMTEMMAKGIGLGLVFVLAQWIMHFAVIFFYFGLFYSKKGATPGKMVLGLKVVHCETGNYIGCWRAFFRETFGKCISGIPLMLGFIVAGFRMDKRALHDFLLSTQVIRRCD